MNKWVDECDHSAVRLPSGLYESKWGMYRGVYRHPADKCPYNISNRTYYKRNPSYVTTLAGPNSICSSGGGTYTVSSNVPVGYTWACSSNLTAGAALGYNKTFSANGSLGSGWIAVRLGAVELAKQYVTIVNTSPVFDYIEGPEAVTPGASTYVYYAHFSGNTDSYTWTISGAPSSWYTYSTSGNALYISFLQEATFCISVTGSNGCGGDNGQLYVSAYNSGSQSQAQAEPFSASYPNPVDEVLRVEINNSAHTPSFDIQLYDWSGNKVRQTTTKSSNVQINVANLPNGIYFLHVYDKGNNKPTIRKIVVRH